MKFAAVKELKEGLLGDLAQHLDSWASRTSVQSIVPERPDRRLAAGYSKVEKDDFHLEIRVQRDTGWAYEKAKEYQAKASGEVTIEVVEKVEIPSMVSLEAAGLPGWISKPYRKRPLHIGLPVGHSEGGSGTLGAFVQGRGEGDCILSCNHVLANSNKADKKAKIFQPGPNEGKGTCLLDNLIARLLNYPELKRTASNETDSAIAELEDGIDHEGNTIPKGYSFSHEGRKIRPKVDLDVLKKETIVCKVGRTTGFTEGKVTAIGLDGLTVFNPSIGNLVFNNVIEVTWLSAGNPFSLPGDSGSLVFTDDGLMPVGLHFAGGPGKSYACALDTILDQLKVTLL